MQSIIDSSGGMDSPLSGLIGRHWQDDKKATFGTDTSASPDLEIYSDGGAGGRIVPKGGALKIVGDLAIWHATEAALDYVYAKHDATNGWFGSASGTLFLAAAGATINFNTGGSNRWTMSSSIFAGASANTRQLGSATLEMLAVYVGQGASSGVYFGSGQEARLYYDSGFFCSAPITFQDTVTVVDEKAIAAGPNDDDYFTFFAKDNGVGPKEVARVAGAAEPYFSLLQAKFGTSVLAADAPHRGMFYYTEGGGGVADILYCVMKNAADGYEAVAVATP